MYSRYLDEKSLVGNRRTGEMEEEKEAENISRIFGRRNPSWVWGRKGLEILEANDIAAWISIESAQLRCSPVT